MFKIKSCLIWFSLLLMISGLSACASYQTEMGNQLPNEHDIPIDQSMPANNDSSVNMD